MEVVVPALAVALAAFCVWLAVRIVNRRERWAKWLLLIVIVGVPSVYLGSFGAWCWTIGRGPLDMQEWSKVKAGDRFYHPILSLWDSGPDPIRSSLGWFANLGTEIRIDVYDVIGDGTLNVLPEFQ